MQVYKFYTQVWLVPESGDYFFQHSWLCGDNSIEVSSRAWHLIEQIRYVQSYQCGKPQTNHCTFTFTTCTYVAHIHEPCRARNELLACRATLVSRLNTQVALPFAGLMCVCLSWVVTLASSPVHSQLFNVARRKKREGLVFKIMYATYSKLNVGEKQPQHCVSNFPLPHVHCIYISANLWARQCCFHFLFLPRACQSLSTSGIKKEKTEQTGQRRTNATSFLSSYETCCAYKFADLVDGQSVPCTVLQVKAPWQIVVLESTCAWRTGVLTNWLHQ